jgi:hypothetical protein
VCRDKYTVINIFQSSYNERLSSWRDLRKSVANMELSDACVSIDNWWQQAPLINHHLHWSDTDNWSDPWSILSENTYCTLTRALGMCYTLLMSVTDKVELVIASDQQCEEHFLVLVDNAKYTLNWWPNSVLSTNLTEFTISRRLSLDPLKNKIK